MEITFSPVRLFIIAAMFPCPAGNVRETFVSPFTGAPPADQFPATDQLPLVAPLHVCEAAASECDVSAAINAKEPQSRAETILDELVLLIGEVEKLI
jgi:hypothetical protein